MTSGGIKIVLFLLFAGLGVAIYFLPNQPSQPTVTQSNVLDDKVSQAVALVQYGGQPMQGIRLLQEVIAENPDHPEALFQLGLFSVQSKQWGKGLQRFERLKEVADYRTKYEEAYYYHALCLASVDSLKPAQQLLEEGLVVAKDSSLIETLSQFRNTIINL